MKYAPVLYGTNAIIGMVNACIIAFSGLKIGVTGMATPMAGAIVLFGFNSPIKSIITIAAVAVTGTILAFIIGSLIKNSTYYTCIFQCHGIKVKVIHNIEETSTRCQMITQPG